MSGADAKENKKIAKKSPVADHLVSFLVILFSLAADVDFVSTDGMKIKLSNRNLNMQQ